MYTNSTKNQIQIHNTVQVNIFTGSYIRDLLIILVKEVIFVEENFAYTQDRALVMFLYDDFNLLLISSCKKQRANMHFN